MNTRMNTMTAGPRRIRWIALLLATVALAGISHHAQAKGGNQNPGVIPPNAEFRGLSYGEWGAQWWRAMTTIPIVDGNHPYFYGGAFEGPNGMLFLSGTGGGAVIDITIRPGTPVFFPVVNAECSVLEPDPFHGADEAELRACANGHIDQTSGLSASIDGVSVNNLDAYRVESPLFEFGPLPGDNIFGAAAGTTTLSVDAGIYVLVAPLSVGKHTITIRGTFDEFDFTIDTTFNITVAP
jgi:hypothetical protein